MPKSRSQKESEKRDVTQSVMGNVNTRKLMEQVEGMAPPAKKDPSTPPVPKKKKASY